MLEVRVRMCGGAHTIVQRVPLRSNGSTSGACYVWDEAGITQAALVMLRLRCPGAIVLSIAMQRALLGVRVGAVVLAAVDAEEVLDLLAGGVVHLAIAVHARTAEDSLVGGIGCDSGRHAGGDATAPAATNVGQPGCVDVGAEEETYLVERMQW